MIDLELLLKESVGRPLQHDGDLFEQGLTSLGLLKVLETIRQKYDIDVDFEVFLANPTAKNLEFLIRTQGHDDVIDQETVVSVEKTGEPGTKRSEMTSWLRQHELYKDLSIERDLFEQGLTSLNLIRLRDEVEAEFDITIDLEAFFKRPRLFDILQFADGSDNLSAIRSPKAVNAIDQMGGSSENRVPTAFTASEEEKRNFLSEEHNLLHLSSIQNRVQGQMPAEQAFAAAYNSRKSLRQFSPNIVAAESLLGWLANLRCVELDGIRRYLYPSAGSTYSVQVFLEVRMNGIDTIGNGFYYYHPVNHELIFLSDRQSRRDDFFFYNRDTYDSAQFCLYFFAENSAIEPLYGNLSESFTQIEVGCMLQLLTGNQSEFGIGSCIMSGVNESEIREKVGHQPSGQLLISLVCGAAGETDEPVKKEVVASASDTSEEYFPLSQNQLGLWALCTTFPEAAAYNCPALLHVQSVVSKERLALAAKKFVNKHPAFKTCFIEHGGSIVQRYEAGDTIDVSFQEAAGLSESEVIGLAKAFAKQPFGLDSGNLLRIRLYSVSGSDHYLLLATHHLVCDGNSLSVLLRDFFNCYQAPALSGTSETPGDDQVYREFVEAENTFLSGRDAQKRLAYWKHKLSDIEYAEGLATDFTRSSVLSYAGATISRTIEKSLTEAVNSFVKQNRVTQASLFLASYTLLLRSLSGKEDVILGFPTAGRTSSNADHVGYFSNMVPLLVQVDAKTQRDDFLLQVQREMLTSLGMSVPFAWLVKALKIQPSVSSYPVFCHSFVFQDFVAYGTSTKILEALSPELKVNIVPGVAQEGEYELVLEVVQRQDSFDLNFKYNPDLYLAETIERFSIYYVEILSRVVISDNQAIDNYLHASSTDQVKLDRWNQTDFNFAKPLVLSSLIEAQCKHFSSNPALSFEGSTLSYSELQDQVTTLAALLQKQGVIKGQLVGVCMYRSIEMVLSILAILKAGAAYVPIDPDFPQDRINFIARDSAVRLVLCQEHTITLCAASKTILVTGSLIQSSILDAANSFIDVAVAEDDAAYVIYTSGSTGKPKGCVLPHRAVVNRILWMQKEFDIGENDSVLQKTPYSFDVSVWEFFWPLIVGARMVLAKPGGHRLPQYLATTIHDENISVCHFVPSMLNAFVESYQSDQALPLRYLFTSGEALTYPQATKAQGIIQGNVVNLYGPTEAAIDVSYWWFEERRDRRIPIGKPIANVQLHVLDGTLSPVPIGVPAELFIGGVCLAEEYINRPELSAEKFIQPPADIKVTGRLYRTGDLVRWLPDGEIEYLGRLDSQVKVRGFRIELGEIEYQISAHDMVVDAVVTTVDLSGEAALAAYYTVSANVQLSANEIRVFLKDSLPEYMIPSFFVQMDAIPLNNSGKANREKLPDPRSGIDTFPAQDKSMNETEAKLAELWKQSLSLTSLSKQQSFFDLGGSSLSAVTMLLEAQKMFSGKHLSQVAFYQDPTIAGLANQLNHAKQNQAQAQQNQLVLLSALNQQEADSVLICCPYAGAGPNVFANLAKSLNRIGGKKAVYSIAIPGNNVGDPEFSEVSFIELAAQVAREAKQAGFTQVSVYGHCVGSFLAYELVKALIARDITVTMLIVGAAFPFPKVFTALPIADPWKLASDKRILKLLEKWGANTKELTEEARRFLVRNFRKDARAAFVHQKQCSVGDKLECPIVCVVSPEDPLTKNYKNSYWRWTRFSDKVHICILEAGNHYFIGDQANEVAGIIQYVEERAVPLCQTSGMVKQWN